VRKEATQVTDRVRNLKSRTAKINTTIYDLIEAVEEEAGAEESRLVTMIVLRLLGRAKLLGNGVIYH
jgi:hypothetical protein